MSKSSEPKRPLIPAEDEPLMKLSTAKYLVSFGIIYILFALDFASRYGMSTLFPMIQKELSLTDPQLGLLVGNVYMQKRNLSNWFRSIMMTVGRLQFIPKATGQSKRLLIPSRKYWPKHRVKITVIVWNTAFCFQRKI